VLLVEREDLASHALGASSELIHSGLRYVEQFDFRLVRLLGIAPHII
jgi:glycerol-3-phosphate dehydrogenase